MLAKILLVDDREDNLFSIESILGSENYEFVRALSGREALKVLLQQCDFALILMDVNMPNLSGFETASLIYERDKLRQIPIIFVTAQNQDDENVFKGYETGAVDYIYKPINARLLRAKVSVFVELYQKTQRLLLHEQRLKIINKNLEDEINERKMSEEKVKALNMELLKNIDRLESANRDLDRFAFMASHDLQEPLRKIRTFSDFLLLNYQEAIDETGKSYITRIQNSAERMQLLIRDIFTFSKIALDHSTFIKTDLKERAKKVAAQFEEQILEQKAEIIIDDLPELYVNPVLIDALFENLISNSLKYRKANVAPSIHIYCEAEAKKEAATADKKINYCKILFKDNGIGFDQKYAQQIFDMFTRLHANATYPGTGIGLALCKKIVEDHDGFISAISNVGVGTTFIISLPLKKNDGSLIGHSAAINMQ